jgi:hypothetical protein
MFADRRAVAEMRHDRRKQSLVVHLHLYLYLIFERFNAGVLEGVELLSDRTDVIDPSIFIRVLLVVRGPAITEAQRRFARFDTSKHGINRFALIVPFSQNGYFSLLHGRHEYFWKCSTMPQIEAAAKLPTLLKTKKLKRLGAPSSSAWAKHNSVTRSISALV